MKTLHLLLAASFMLASTAVSAKTLEVSVSDIRNDKGNILFFKSSSCCTSRLSPVYSPVPFATRI